MKNGRRTDVFGGSFVLVYPQSPILYRYRFETHASYRYFYSPASAKIYSADRASAATATIYGPVMAVTLSDRRREPLRDLPMRRSADRARK